MIETFLLTLILLKINKYRLNYMFKDWSFYLIFFQLAAYIYLESTIFREDYTFLPFQKAIKTVFIMCYFIVAFKHRLSKFSVFKNVKNETVAFITSPFMLSSVFMILGCQLNSIVMSLNNGLMPVYIYSSKLTGYGVNTLLKGMQIKSDFHILWTEGCKAFWLTDIIDLSYTVLSIGDVFIRLFSAIIIYYSIKKLNLKYL